MKISKIINTYHPEFFDDSVEHIILNLQELQKQYPLGRLKFETHYSDDCMNFFL